MVPVVYGATLQNYRDMAPPHSFIHVDEFSNAKKLADYLRYLDSNDTAYASYHAWRDHGAIWVSIFIVL